MVPASSLLTKFWLRFWSHSLLQTNFFKRLYGPHTKRANKRCRTYCHSKLTCFGFKQKPFALQDSNHYLFEQKTFCNMRIGTPISIIDKMSLLSPFVVGESFCLVMFSFFSLDPKWCVADWDKNKSLSLFAYLEFTSINGNVVIS